MNQKITMAGEIFYTDSDQDNHDEKMLVTNRLQGVINIDLNFLCRYHIKLQLAEMIKTYAKIE